MPNAQYHHGTETRNVDRGMVPIYSVESAIVGIVGTAPTGPVNQLIQCVNERDFAQFGTIIQQGFTLPDAFDVLLRYNSGKFYVVNVLDPAKHRSKIEDEKLIIDEVTLRAKTEKIALQTVSLKDGELPLIEGTDYSVIMETGDFQFNARPTDSITATYEYADPTLVTADEIKGGYDAVTHSRKGMELWREGFQRFNMDAKVLIAPWLDEDVSVARELSIYREKLGAVCYINAPKETTLSEAITGRGPLGKISFNTSDEGTMLCYGYINGHEPLALHQAGLRMWMDVNRGYWHSTSNNELRGVTSVEPILTARIDDVNSETNQLNAVGITTVFNSYGTGHRMWGNRLASFPTVTHIKNFEVVKRSQLIIDESIRRAELQFIDRPIDAPLIDSLLESVDAFGRDLCGINGPLLGFECWWSESNSERTLSMGQYFIAYKFTPKVPGERITNESYVTSEYLGTLNSQLREQYNVSN